MLHKTNSRQAPRQVSGGEDKNKNQQQRSAATTNNKIISRVADDLSSLAAELAFRLAAVARSAPSARAARLAVDALTLAEHSHQLADALSIALEVGEVH